MRTAAAGTGSASTEDEDYKYSRGDLALLALSALTNTACWAAFLPTLALLVTRELDQPAAQLGWLKGLFALSCFCGFGIAPFLMHHVASRTVLVGGLLLRCIAGAMHVAACARAALSAADALILPLLYASRFAHGVQFFTMALGTSWVALRMPAKQRMAGIGALGTAAGVGSAIGPIAGSYLAGYYGESSRLEADAAPGWLLIGISGALALAVMLLFGERDAPLAPPDAGSESVPKGLVFCVLSVAFFGFAGLLALEGVLGLVLWEVYGLDSSRQFAVFSTFAIAGIVAAGAAVGLDRACAKPKLGAIGPLALLPSALLLVRWDNLGEAVTYDRFIGGLVGLAFATSFICTLAASVLVTRLEPSQQPRWNSLTLMAGMLGRSAGPPAALMMYTAAANTAAAGVAPANAAMCVTVVGCALAQLVPLYFFKDVFGAADGDAGAGHLL